MLEIVKGQTLRNKIPAGLPSGFTSGNKTGEMPEGYGLGCIENDSAIVFAPEGMGEGYILTVMSNRLGGRNSEAISLIVQISSKVAKWYIEQHS
jgi:beta-lactamase class A